MTEPAITAPAAGACHAATGRTAGLPWPEHVALWPRALAWGGTSAALLLAAYAGLVGWANSFAHALETFVWLWRWMVPLVAGFGIQVGLFVYLRGAARASGGAHAGGVVASGGVSTVSMAACCAHHLADVLPLVGLAGAGLFLSTYQTLFLLLGVLSSALGTLYLLSLVGRHRLAPARGSLLSPALALTARQWRVVLVLAAAVAALLLAVGVWHHLAWSFPAP